VSEAKKVDVILPDTGDGNASVDKIRILAGDTTPTQLTEDQIKRLHDAGVKVERVDGKDPADVLKGEALDNALQDKGLPTTGSVEEKRDRLRNIDKGA
jgi:hypothetical protein